MQSHILPLVVANAFSISGNFFPPQKHDFPNVVGLLFPLWDWHQQYTDLDLQKPHFYINYQKPIDLQKGNIITHSKEKLVFVFVFVY